jgi:hypothetical protein
MFEQGETGTTHKLSWAQIKVLDDVGFAWEVDVEHRLQQPARTFVERIEELRAYKEKYGHCNISNSRSPANRQYLSLAKWCGRVRNSRRVMLEQEKRCSTHIPLSPARIKMLDEVGFSWYMCPSFKDRIEELKAFKEKYGHCNVPCSRKNWSHHLLAKWSIRIRLRQREAQEGKLTATHKNLTQDQIKSLTDIGFEW